MKPFNTVKIPDFWDIDGIMEGSLSGNIKVIDDGVWISRKELSKLYDRSKSVSEYKRRNISNQEKTLDDETEFYKRLINIFDSTKSNSLDDSNREKIFIGREFEIPSDTWIINLSSEIQNATNAIQFLKQSVKTSASSFIVTSSSIANIINDSVKE